MKVKGMLRVGFLSIVAAIGVVNTSDSFASDVQRVHVSERIGHGGSSYSHSQPDGMGACNATGVERMRLDVIERIGAGGSTYSSSQPKFVRAGDCNVAGGERTKVNIIERIGAGGSTYSSSQPNIQTADR